MKDPRATPRASNPGLPGELGERACGIFARARAAPIGRKIEMAEADPRRLLELVSVLLVPGLEFFGRRLARRRDILGEELHLLRHAALHDRVLLVETHRESFAVQNLLLHLALDQPAQLLRRRLAAPLRLEHDCELRELVEGQLDLLRRFDTAAPAIDV
jgi:hypothetical protein